ncbi:MAG: glycosyltransferase family 4 protein [Planctomycetaceae bacterium]|nr:glycosyltransferase family 4 protein [Planctomycetaceae bacterium]
MTNYRAALDPFMLFYGLCIFFTLVATLTVTGLIRRYTVQRNILDIPNDRSSHFVPTPRGGGAGFVVITIWGAFVLYAMGDAPREMVASFTGGGALVALVGWLDDKGGLRRRYRFAAHLLAAAWAVSLLTPPEAIPYIPYLPHIPGFAIVFFFLALVWMINSYNFMDGIDGLAGWQGMTVCFVGGYLFLVPPAPALMTAAAVLGFLVWNWPKARIFMGAVGSGFLGFVIGVSWLATSDTPAGFWGWPVLMAVFFVDATCTLILRIYRGENWRDSHRSHAYQIVAQRWGHTRVTLAVIVINIVWLTPWATMISLYPTWAAWTAIVAYAPIVCLWICIKRRHSA